jgi:hypothetical protein
MMLPLFQEAGSIMLTYLQASMACLNCFPASSSLSALVLKLGTPVLQLCDLILAEGLIELPPPPAGQINIAIACADKASG